VGIRMSIKTFLRNAITRNSTIRMWFVALCARFTTPLFILQRYLSFEDLKNLRLVNQWRHVVSSLEKLPLEKVVIANGKSTFYYQNGLSFHVIASKTSMSNVLLTTSEYEKSETRTLQNVVKPGWIVVDAGANFGWYSVQLSKLVGAEGRVLAFEPVPDSFSELLANVSLNHCQNVDTFSIALGNRAETMNLYVPEFSMGMGAASEFLDRGQKVSVLKARLDDFFRSRGLSRLDFIKADIEGGELYLLEGAGSLLDEFHPQLLLEIVDVHCRRFGHSPTEVFEYLSKKGYVGYFIEDNGRLVKPDSRCLPNGNYLFEWA
jgi:FkbM family methyltransferase